MQICRGLQYAHTFGELNLVHRDLCPANVLVSYFGEVKTAGFGMTYAMSDDETQRTIYGRPSYLAPEQLDPGVEPDRRTDVYTVGIMLWEMLVGRPMRPEIKSSAEALKVIRQATVTPPSVKNGRLPPQIDPLVVKALQPRPEHRHATAEVLRKALARALAQIEPTFESGQLAEIMKALYRRQIEAARAERKRLLAADFQHLRGKSQPGPVKGPTGPGGDAPSTSGEVDLSGQRISDRYRVIRLIGEGGMGAVYEAEHIEIRRRVAIKVLHAAYSRDTEAVTRFREEARAATKIGHPNIIQVTDSGATDDGRFFFVMELLAGTDLANLMAEQRTLPIERSLKIVAQICEALHAAHEAGIIHRDLKPENIFLSDRNGESDFVTLLDFGIAKNVDLAKEGEARLTTPGIAIGTPEYMAPEQAAGEEIDRRIDVYATSTMLYEMLTGRLPHTAQNLMQLLNKKASEPPTPPSQYRAELAGELEQAILAALAAERDQRTPTMRELGSALDRYRALRLGTDPTVPFATTGQDGTAEASNVAPLPAQSQPAEPSLVVPLPAAPMWPGRVALLVAVGVLVVALSGLGLWWVTGHRASVDAGADLGAEPAVDAGAAVDASRGDGAVGDGATRMAPEEMARLLEWAKRAAVGRRYLKPRGDNVRELLERIVAHYPEAPQVVAFRRWLARSLASRARWARRRRADAAAVRVYRAWLELIPEDPRPRRQLLTVLIKQGQKALSRRRFKAAQKHASQARELAPRSASPLLLLGDIAARRRRLNVATRHYKEALRAPESTRWQRRLVRARLKRLRRR